MTHEEFLLHYGVKGMRWGVRKQYNRVKSNIRSDTDGLFRKSKLTDRDLARKARRHETVNQLRGYKRSWHVSRSTKKKIRQTLRNRGTTPTKDLSKLADRAFKEKKLSKSALRGYDIDLAVKKSRKKNTRKAVKAGSKLAIKAVTTGGI